MLRIGGVQDHLRIQLQLTLPVLIGSRFMPFRVVQRQIPLRCLKKTVLLDEKSDSPSIHVYPNPVSNDLHIEIDHFKEGMSLSIKNMSGQLISQISMISTVQVVDVSKHKPGLYMLELIDSGSILYRSKIVVHK